MRLSLHEVALPSADSELLYVMDHQKMLIAYLTLRRYADAWLVCDIFTIAGQRHKGHAGDLLRQAIEVSEETDLPLVLHVAGSGAPDTLDDEELTAWYRRYGFDAHPEWDDPTVLMRSID